MLRNYWKDLLLIWTILEVLTSYDFSVNDDSDFSTFILIANGLRSLKIICKRLKKRKLHKFLRKKWENESSRLKSTSFNLHVNKLVPQMLQIKSKEESKNIFALKSCIITHKHVRIVILNNKI